MCVDSTEGRRQSMDTYIVSPGDGWVDPTMLHKMFRLRKSVFSDRLGWDVNVQDGKEHDQFDDINAVYIACVDEFTEVQGCWRLIPTTSPYMLRDVFPELLWGLCPPSDPSVWEISRFGVAFGNGSANSLGCVSEITLLMLRELFRFAATKGIRRIVGVTDLRFERILNRSGLITERFGPPLPMGVTTAVAGWADVSTANLDAMALPVALAIEAAE